MLRLFSDMFPRFRAIGILPIIRYNYSGHTMVCMIVPIIYVLSGIGGSIIHLVYTRIVKLPHHSSPIISGFCFENMIDIRMLRMTDNQLRILYKHHP